MSDEDRARFASSIRNQSERLAQMIDKLLALAAVEHRQRLEQPEWLEPASLAREAAAHCAQRLDQAGISLRLMLAPQLPRVRGDGFLLRQALVNLIDNAADFSPLRGEIELHMDADGSQLRIDVADRGQGIPDYAMPRVFERFYSLPRPDGGSRSSGLGLCFVAEVAALHDGTVELRNRDGGGAIATLEIPL
jgi:two-component system sensor histidine kinase CreC